MNNKDIRRISQLITEDPDVFNESTDLINETDIDLRLLQRKKGDSLEDLANYYRASKRHGEDLTGREHEEDPIGQQVSRLNSTDPNAALIARVRSNRRLWRMLDLEYGDALWFQAPLLPDYIVTVYLPTTDSAPGEQFQAATSVFVEGPYPFEWQLDSIQDIASTPIYQNIGALSQGTLDYLESQWGAHGEHAEDLEGEDRFYQELNVLYARFLQRGGLEHNEQGSG